MGTKMMSQFSVPNVVHGMSEYLKIMVFPADQSLVW